MFMATASYGREGCDSVWLTRWMKDRARDEDNCRWPFAEITLL